MTTAALILSVVALVLSATSVAIHARTRPPKPQRPLAEEILCSDPACTSRRFKHSHAEGWPEHPSYRGTKP